MTPTHAREIELKKIIQTAIDCEDNYRVVLNQFGYGHAEQIKWADKYNCASRLASVARRELNKIIYSK